jgi:hypothetical protein
MQAYYEMQSPVNPYNDLATHRKQYRRWYLAQEKHQKRATVVVIISTGTRANSKYTRRNAARTYYLHYNVLPTVQAENVI